MAIIRSRDYLDEKVEQAYWLQLKGSLEGAARWTVYSSLLMVLANQMFPFVKRQTLAGKCFMVSWGTIFGLVTWQERYLQDFEHHTRFVADKPRQEAMAALSKSGIIPSETQIQAWIRQNRPMKD